ncbi:MAG: helix-turn-helix domain-containing protein [Actinomycetota bacterium]
MARPREFDAHRVVDVALESFWTNGFAATSMQDLVDATRVNRASLYGAFESKAGLYGHALDRYADAGCQQLDRLLAEDGDIVTRLERYADELFASPDGRGCFVGNSLCELADTEPALHATAVDHANRVRHRIRDAAATAAAAGASLAAPPEDVADIAMAAIHGAHVMSKAGVDPERIRRGLRFTLATLRS